MTSYCNVFSFWGQDRGSLLVFNKLLTSEPSRNSQGSTQVMKINTVCFHTIFLYILCYLWKWNVLNFDVPCSQVTHSSSYEDNRKKRCDILENGKGAP